MYTATLRLKNARMSVAVAAAVIMGSMPATAEGPKIEAALASVNTADYTNPRMQLLFIEKVKEKTDGGLDIRWIGSGQLGGLKENLEAIIAGNLEMAGVNNANLGPLYSGTQLFDLPFIFRDYDHMKSVVRGPIGDRVHAGLEKATGIKLIMTGLPDGARLTRPGILVPAKVRENLMEEDKTDANAEVQTGTDRNGAETDRGGHGEWEVDAAGLQGGWDSYSDVLSVAEGVWRSEGGAGQTAEGVGEGKHPVETTGSRAVAGEAGVKGCSGGKLLSPERRRCAVERAEMRYGMSERHACRLLGQSRGTQRYEPMRRADEDRLTAAVVALASEYGRYGYKKIAAMLQRSGWQAGRDRVERIWRREGLKVPQKQRPRRRLWLNDGSCIRLRPERANHVWSYDFVNARTHDGRLLRILALIDEYTRECLALRVARRLNSQDVIETLSEVMLWRGIPEHIRSDNGPEFVARQLRDWLQGLGTSPLYIEPGSPWENGYCESFNGKLREECLNGEIFYSLKEARIVIEQWRQQYNRVRPHAALGYRPPAPGAYTPPWNPVPRPQVIM